MRCSSLARAACAALLLICIAINLHGADAFTCSGGSGRAECGVSWPEGGPYYTPSSSCSSCSGCSCPAASCMQVVSACLAAPGLVSYEVGFTGCKGSNGSSASSAIDWVAFQGIDSAGKSFSIQSALNPNTTLYTFDNTTACDNIYSVNSTSTCCLQRNVNGNGQINQFTVPCGTRPLAWMMDSTFRSCIRPENIPPYLTDTSGPNQCSGAGPSTTGLCGPYELEALTCESLLPCSGASRSPASSRAGNSDSAQTQLETEDLPALTSEVSTTTVWTEYYPTCVVGSICRYARNPCELDAYWQPDCSCPDLNPLRYGYCRYTWDSSSADSATCVCGADVLLVTYVAVYYPAYRRWPGYWCDWGDCGNNWGWDWCWRRPCRPICWGWGCPSYPWWLDRPRPVFWPGIRPVWWSGGYGWGCRHKGCGGYPGSIHVGCIGRDCIFNVGRRPGLGGGRLLGNDCRGSHCRQLCSSPFKCPSSFNSPTPRSPSNRFNRGGFGAPLQLRNFNTPRIDRTAALAGAVAGGLGGRLIGKTRRDAVPKNTAGVVPKTPMGGLLNRLGDVASKQGSVPKNTAPGGLLNQLPAGFGATTTTRRSQRLADLRTQGNPLVNPLVNAPGGGTGPANNPFTGSSVLRRNRPTSNPLTGVSNPLLPAQQQPQQQPRERPLRTQRPPFGTGSLFPAAATSGNQLTSNDVRPSFTRPTFQRQQSSQNSFQPTTRFSRPSSFSQSSFSQPRGQGGRPSFCRGNNCPPGGRK